MPCLGLLEHFQDLLAPELTGNNTLVSADAFPCTSELSGKDERCDLHQDDAASAKQLKEEDQI